MPKFILLYKGPTTPDEMIDEVKGLRMMQNWKDWLLRVGSAMVDAGSPLSNGQSFGDNGSLNRVYDFSGYSIISADDIYHALKLVDSHPFLDDKTGKYSVEVYELFPATKG